MSSNIESTEQFKIYKMEVYHGFGNIWKSGPSNRW